MRTPFPSGTHCNQRNGNVAVYLSGEEWPFPDTSVGASSQMKTINVDVGAFIPTVRSKSHQYLCGLLHVLAISVVSRLPLITLCLL